MIPSNTDRITSLDSLRGMAALMVVLFHYTYNFEQKFGHSIALPITLPFGHYGVELFFVISGFVILMTIDRSERLKDFLFSRATRLYPTYWCSALLTFSAISLIGLSGRDVTGSTLAINMTMLQGLFNAPMIDQVYWTLHQELGFYLLAALIMLAQQRNRIVGIFSALVLFNMAAMHFSLIENVPGAWRIWNAIPLAYLHLFLFGMLAWEGRDGWRKEQYIPLLIASIGAFQQAGFVYFAINIGCFMLVFLSIRHQPRLLCHKIFVFLGTISYALYLVHANIGYIIIINLERMNVLPIFAIGAAIATSLALASLVTFAIERPSIRLARGWYNARKQTAR